MTRIKKLKEHNSLLGLSIIDLLTEIDPSKTNKFVPVMIKIIKNKFEDMFITLKNQDEREYLIDNILELYPNITKSELSKSTDLDIVIRYFKRRLIADFINTTELNSLFDFIHHFERGLISCDLGNIKNINQIETLLSLSKVKDFEKENSKTIKIEYRDDEWLLLRPLTYQSSLKYGAGTKWCTASKHNPEHFFRYSERGILAYCINLKTGEKFGYFKELRIGDSSVNYDLELSFWNMADNRIDSMQCNFPETIYSALRSLDDVTNKSFVGENWEIDKKSQYEMYLKNEVLRESTEPVTEAPPLRVAYRNYENNEPNVAG